MAVLCVGPLRIDPERLKVSFHEKTIELSRYEFRLLQTLAEQPGRVFSRTQLMERVWEDPGMSLERTVDTHIKTIRQKLRAITQDSDPIVTHRGIGYSLAENCGGQ